jgi:endonuclease/exonuclease/phosphatase family metal-dependent hydrolase
MAGRRPAPRGDAAAQEGGARPGARRRSAGAAELRVLTWNLFHGRSLPPAGGELLEAFAEIIAGWDWDVALLQELPPWWASSLARAAGASERSVLTSRNALLPLRRALAERRPDWIKSNGGGANAILARTAIVEHRTLRLRLWPERRVAQLARLAEGTSVVNFHGSARASLAAEELERLWGHALAWAGEGRLIVGGDLNLRSPSAPRPEILHVAERDVDHIFARGFDPLGDAQRLDRGVTLASGEAQLSDHIPLAVSLRAAVGG